MRYRGRIETIFGKLKENRRLVVRYEKDDLNFLGMIAMGMIKIMIKRDGGILENIGKKGRNEKRKGGRSL
ncbi:MAG: hypothetical protein Ta2D_12110 [Rickettsiales bacterium]|nr:MAG: hypothetical protein Ta2D_12110 [Rickettsiales bacterium]